MFLELASLAVHEFSCDYFKRFFGEFIFFYTQEKNLQVAHTFVSHVLTFREGFGSSSSSG